jgi:catechol 2,3-dioxygenase-like lactoylglutathione lyase family enzyme
MQVKRIVANIQTSDPAAAKAFYQEILGSGTPLPGLSIEVDDVDEAFSAMSAAGFEVTYGPADEPWGVRRFYVRDPFGTLVNIVSHRS